MTETPEQPSLFQFSQPRREPSVLTRRVNVGAAVAAVLVLSSNYPSSAYVWFIGHGMLAPLVMIAGPAALAYYGYRWWKDDKVLRVPWVVCGLVLIAFIARTAVLDAHQLHFANCWRISGTDAASTWECVPGRSEPAQWTSSYNPNTDEDSPGNYCEFVDSSSSGGTIWHCSSG